MPQPQLALELVAATANKRTIATQACDLVHCEKAAGMKR